MVQAVTAGSDVRGRSGRWSTRPSRDEVAAIARRTETSGRFRYFVR